MTINNKKITPVGKIRKKKSTDGGSEVYGKTQETKMLEESNHSDILDDDVFTQVKKIAMQNSQLKSIIDQAKAFTYEKKDKIKDQCTNIVAFYHIAKEKPFFFVSPAEARIAIDYIKQTRQGYQKEIESEAARDSCVKGIIDNIESLNLQTDPKKLNGIKTKAFNKDVDNQVGTTFSIESNDIDDLSIYKPIGAISETSQLLNVKTLKKEDKDIIDQVRSNNYIFNTRIKGGPFLSLALLNQVFSHVESKDLLVNIILLNSNKISDIRGMGKTIYDHYSYKVQSKRKCFGRIWTAEIYPCNALNDNQIIIGSFDAQTNTGFFYHIIMTK